MKRIPIILCAFLTLALYSCTEKDPITPDDKTDSQEQTDPDPEPEPDPQPEPDPEPEPQGDLLDIVFYKDGTAKDISAQKMTVTTLQGAPMLNCYNTSYGRYVAHFNHTLFSTTATGYQKIDYSSNSDFRNRIADGCTWETVFRLDEEFDGSNEAKMFCATQSGGAGFLLAKTDPYDICFIVRYNDGSAAWSWARSGIKPEKGRYYHVTGVYDKEKQQTRIYIDGQLKGTGSAPGSYVHPASNYQYISVGGDPGSGGSTNSWHGDIAVARIYDDVLTDEQIAAIYGKCSLTDPLCDLPFVTKPEFLGEANVAPGLKFNIFADQFQDGDSFYIEKIDTPSDTKNWTLPAEYGNGRLGFRIPSSGFETGKYGIYLRRAADGSKDYPIGCANLTLGDKSDVHTVKTVAHRGLHDDANVRSENSIAALRGVAPLGIYASELDVWITPDDVVVVNHNNTFPTDAKNRYIQDTPYTEMGDIRLQNGEPVPTLEEYIKVARELGIRLVIEIKTQRVSADGTHTARENNDRVIDASIALVKKYDYVGMCDWIAFDYTNCKRIVSALPGSMVEYLNGDYAPGTCFNDGIMGIDYTMTKLTDAWIEKAHELGMIVNVWTVNSSSDILNWINKGVDFITTNDPVLCKDLTEKQFLVE